MELKHLNDETLKQAIKLKCTCWQEELAGKVKHELNEKEEYDFWQKWMHDGDKHQDVRTLIGIFQEDQLIACAFASFAEIEDHPSAVEINGLFVDQAQRNKHLSYKMLAYILSRYKDLNKDAVIIYNHKHAPSNTYYNKLGGKVINTLTQLDGKLEIEVFEFSLDELIYIVDKGD